MRLLTLVDDFGRYEADPQLLRNEAFPYGGPVGADIEMNVIVRGLMVLEAADLLFIYEHDGSVFLQLTRWKERKRSESRYPDPKTAKKIKADTMLTNDSAVLTNDSKKSEVIQIAEDEQKCQHDAGMPLTNDSAVLSPPPKPTPIALAIAVPPNPQKVSAKKRLHGIPETVEEVIAFGKSLRPVVPEKTCRNFWAHYEGQARCGPDGSVFWVTSGDAVVTNWKVKLPSFGGLGSEKSKEPHRAERNQRQEHIPVNIIK